MKMLDDFQSIHTLIRPRSVVSDLDIHCLRWPVCPEYLEYIHIADAPLM